MVGSATLTIVASRMTMNWAAQTRTSVTQRFSVLCMWGAPGEEGRPPQRSSAFCGLQCGLQHLPVGGFHEEPRARIAARDRVDRDTAVRPDGDHRGIAA